MVSVINIKNKHGLTHAQQEMIVAKIRTILSVYDRIVGDETRIEMMPNLPYDTIEDMD